MYQNLIALFEATAERFPEHIAVADRETVFSFARLRQTARAIGTFLSSVGCRGKAVAVYARHEAWTPVMLLSVLYAGGYYVPLDEDAPPEKRERVLQSAGAVLAIYHGEKVEGAVPVGQDLADSLPPCPLPGTGKDDLAYLVYTSGSTGVPKGVAKSHGAVLSYLEAFTGLYPFDETNILGNQTPFFFDASAKDLYLMAATGCRLEVIPAELFSFPVKLVEYMNERVIDTISWVPSALSIVTRLNTFSEILPQSLRRVFFVGEVFPMKQLNKWRKALPNISYVNLYGSSELAGVACHYPVEGEFDDGDSLPIGRPLPNCDVKLVCEGRVVTEPEVVGELYIASPALALGYFGDLQKTGEAFPRLNLGDGEKRYFRTGDMARYDEQGRLVFAARRDYQIKHMGRRVELGEIEAAAGGIPGINACCCLYDGEKQKIVLLCSLTEGSGLTGKDIRTALREKLSDYMVPARVKLLPSLPLNPNGKIDRQLLRQEL